MKKTVTSIFLLLALGARSQVLLDEDFSTATGTTPPTGWTNNDIAAAGDSWVFNNPGGQTLNSPITDPAAIFDSDNTSDNSAAEDCALESPTFDVSGFSAVYLEFDQYFYQSFADATISVEVYDGTSWNQVYSSTTNTPDPDHQQINITTAANGSANAQVRFHWTGTWDYYWIVDNVTVTGANCAAPSALTSSNVTGSSVDLSWTPGGSETEWTIEYGPAGFTPGSGTTVDVTSSTYTVSPLNSNTSYDFYVQANCSASDSSIQAGPYNVITACVPTPVSAFPWTEDMENAVSPALPCGWTAEDVNGDGIEWITYDYAPNSGTNALYMEYNSSEAMNDWVYTPELQLLASDSYAFTFSYIGSGTTFPEKMEVYIGSTASATGMTTQLIDLPNITNDSYNTETIYFTIPTDGSYYIGFHGYSDANEFFISVDDVMLDYAPACVDVSNIMLNSAFATEATISWTPGFNETAWNIEYGPTGFTPGTGITGTASGTPTFQMSPLTPLTGYDVYVQSDCGGGDQGSWVGPFNFTTTDCTPVAVTSYPWLENFDAETIPEIPCGWVVANLNNDPYTWVTDDTDPSTSPNSLYIRWNGSQAMNDWIYTPELVLESDSTYELTFNYNTGGGYDEDLQVYIGTMQNDGSMNTQLVDLTGITNDTYMTSTTTFTVPSNGSYYIGFHGFSIANQYYMVIDDIGVDYAPSCPDVSAITLDDITNMTADFSWTAGATETAWNIEYGPTGFTPGSGTADNASGTPDYQASGLTPETTYDIYVQADCGSESSEWVGPFTFTTLCTPQVISAFPWMEDFEGVTMPDLPCGWTIDDVNGDDITWVTDDYLPNSGINALYMKWNANEDMNDWVYTPEIQMLASGNYILKFSYVGSGTTFPENLEVFIGTDASVSGMTTQMIDLPNLTNDTYNNEEIMFTVPADGSYYIGFHGYSDADQFFISVDDVGICEVQSGDMESNAIAVNAFPYTNTGNTGDCFTDQGGEASADVYYMLTTGECADSIDVDLCNSTFDSYVRILDASGTELASNGDGCGTNGQITGFAVSPMTSYYVVVEGDGTATGDYELNIEEYSSVADASFTLAEDSLCTDGMSVTPVIDGETGGTFSSTAGLSVDATTGEIDPTNSTPGSYYLVYSVGTAPCDNTDSVEVLIVDCSTGSVSENFFSNIELYPNPTNGLLNLSLPSTAAISFTVLDFTGKEVSFESQQTGAMNWQLDLSGLAEGVYFVKFDVNGTQAMKKIVLKR